MIFWHLCQEYNNQGPNIGRESYQSLRLSPFNPLSFVFFLILLIQFAEARVNFHFENTAQRKIVWEPLFEGHIKNIVSRCRTLMWEVTV